MPHQIRRATAADAATIHRFICELAAYEREPDAVEATVEGLAAQMSLPVPPFECLMAELDGQPVGFALTFTNYSTWKGRPGLFLEDLFVTPEHRGKGIGLGLLRALAAIAVERGYGRMEWNVLTWNQPAIDFYEALHAEPLDEWRTYRLTGAALAAVGGAA
jgi:GNAT superfamily N-acetyltransferase